MSNIQVSLHGRRLGLASEAEDDWLLREEIQELMQPVIA